MEPIEKVYHNEGNQDVINHVIGEKLEILDVGCGAGDNAAILSKMGHIVDGITHSTEEAALCAAFMRRVFVVDIANGLPEGISNSYDYVICSHVLEHLAYPDRLLLDIRKVLKEGGKLLVALPNIMHYSPRIKLLMGKFDYAESGIWDNTHLRWYTYSTGRKLLERNGYVVTKQWVQGEIPGLRLFRCIPIRIRKGLFRILSSLSRGMFAGQLLYEAKPSS